MCQCVARSIATCSFTSLYLIVLPVFLILNPTEPSDVAYGYAAVSTDVRGHTQLKICL